MFICIELSELIIYCKYDWKFSVFEVIYLSALYFFANPLILNIQKTYERYTKPENLGFCYQPINMPNDITRHYQRYIKNPAELLQWSSYTKVVNG